MAVSRLSQSTLQNAFSKYNSIWDGKSVVGSMDPIGSILFSTATTGATFYNIPQTYTHLQVRFLIASVGTNMDWSWIINGVSSGTSYAFRHLKSDGAGPTVSQIAYTSQPYGYLLRDEYSGGVPNGTYLSGIIDLLDYTNTNKYKTMKATYCSEQNSLTAGLIKHYSCIYESTSPVTRLDLYNGYLSWGANSQFSLYGIK